MKAALYARVSTRDKNQDPEVQLAELRKYCSENNIEITGEYVDQAPAADFVRRIRWAQLMKDAAGRKFRAVLVWKLDRAFRDIGMALNTVKTLRAQGIDFVVTTAPILSVTGPAGDLMFSIYAAFAQFEKDLLVERVNAGLALARSRGKIFGRPRRALPVKKVLDAWLACSFGCEKAAQMLIKQTGEKIGRGMVHNRLKEEARSRGFSSVKELRDFLGNTLSETTPPKIQFSDVEKVVLN